MIYRAINWNDFDQSITPNFVVGEVSNRDARRVVSDPRVADRVIGLARELQKARDFVRSPIIITSWYRPAIINSQIGGATNSRHIQGDAADFYISGYEFQRMLAIFRRNWSGFLFAYPKRQFLHVDRRNGGGWIPGASPAYYEQLE